jgi:hypothetical protein
LAGGCRLNFVFQSQSGAEPFRECADYFIDNFIYKCNRNDADYSEKFIPSGTKLESLGSIL